MLLTRASGPQFGIELDDVTTEKQIIRKEHHKQAEEVGEDEEARALAAVRSALRAHAGPRRSSTRSTYLPTATTCSASRRATVCRAPRWARDGVTEARVALPRRASPAR